MKIYNFLRNENIFTWNHFTLNTQKTLLRRFCEMPKRRENFANGKRKGNTIIINKWSMKKEKKKNNGNLDKVFYIQKWIEIWSMHNMSILHGSNSTADVVTFVVTCYANSCALFFKTLWIWWMTINDVLCISRCKNRKTPAINRGKEFILMLMLMIKWTNNCISMCCYKSTNVYRFNT